MRKLVLKIKDTETEDLFEALGVDEEELTNRLRNVTAAYKDSIDELVKGNCEDAEMIIAASLIADTPEELAIACYQAGQVSERQSTIRKMEQLRRRLMSL